MSKLAPPQQTIPIGTRTGSSWNPWMGCHKLNPNSQLGDSGCTFCYMYREVRAKQRMHRDWNPNVVRRCKTTWTKPLRWGMNRRQMIFSCSWSDFFINEADPWRAEAWDVIRRTPWHVYRICTKRPERIRPPGGPSLLPPDWDASWNTTWRHVWLGCTVEHQNHVKRMDYIRSIPCAFRWVSAEPLLSELDLNLKGFGFLVDGGESGGRDEDGNWEKIRPANLDWFRSLRDQCQAAGVLYCHKQHGGTKKCSKAMHAQLFGRRPFPTHLRAWGCRVLDGRLHDDFPPMPPYP